MENKNTNMLKSNTNSNHYKMNKFLSAIFIVSLFSFNLAQAQTKATPNQELRNFTPPSPSAYELGKFGEIPIGMFTGTQNVSVPLVEFKTKNFTIPLSLLYSSNGIQVDRLETKVGLGWNLEAGGVITRTVHQNPDELSGYTRPLDDGSNYLSFNWAEYYNNLTYQIDGTSQPLSIDAEPDIFSFNFLGRTGRFTIDNGTNNGRKIVLLDNVALKIVYNPENTGGFLITDEQGNKYFFTETENTQMITTCGSSACNNLGQVMATSWNLTRIESLKKEQIFFDYNPEDYQYITTQSQSITLRNDPISDIRDTGLVQCSSTVSAMSCVPWTFSYSLSQIVSHTLVVKGKRLWRIRSSNPVDGSITLDYNQLHPEVSNYPLLTAVNYLKNTNVVLEKASLDYNNVSQRLFLNKVQFLDPEKNYKFEYNDLTFFPERLSKSQDHWGYYNGKSNSVIYPDTSQQNNPLSVLGNRIKGVANGSLVGANKEIDETKAKKGLLKKITYPTKGYTEFEYESNTYNELQEVSIATPVKLELISNRSGSDTKSIIIDSFKDGLVKINPKLDFQYYPNTVCGPGNGFPPVADKKLFIQIKNLTNTTQTDIIKRMDGIYGVPTGIGNSIVFSDLVISDEYFFNLTKNNKYEITISVFYDCLTASLEFGYIGIPTTYQLLNIKTSGLRIAKTTNFDPNATVLSSKSYYYARKDYLDRSTGVKGNIPYYDTVSFEGGACFPVDQNCNSSICSPWMHEYVTLNSGSRRALYDTEIQNTRYQYVTVSENGANFTNGGIEYEFRLSDKSQSYPIMGTFSEQFSEGDKYWGNGLELQKTYFKKEGSVFKNIMKETNNYERDTRVNNTVTGFTTSRKFREPCIALPSGDNQINTVWLAKRQLNVTRYYLLSNWYYLSSKTTETYDTNGSNPVTTTTKYYYDNPLHTQVSRTETTDSKGNIDKNEIKYPQDLLIRTAAEDKLITQGKIAVPIKIDNYTNKSGNNELASSVYNQYTDWGNEIVEIEKVKTSKFNDPLENRITYYKYDSKGNPLEFSKVDGVHVVYLWGYNSLYPVAKIENTTYAAIEALSGFGLNFTLVNGLTAAQETTLRTNLPNAMVSTFAYDALIRITSITDPKAYTTYYTYDAFNRLSQVKEKTSIPGATTDLLNQNDYHYKN
jgi:YD repeat-containing protein